MSLIAKLETLKSTYAQSIVNKNINGIMELYAPEAMYKPAFTKVVRADLKQIRDYFIGCREYQDPGFLNEGIINIKFLQSEELETEGLILSSGVYEFHYSDRSIKKAEYTMACKMYDDKLRIVSQHSNLLR